MDVPTDVIVVGAGAVGLACAWRLAQAGARVVLIDDDGPAASQVAAGMLAPVTEAAFGEDALLRLNLLAAQQFPDLVDELDHAADARVPLRREGILSVAASADDRAELDRLEHHRHQLGLATIVLTGHEVRQREPYLSTSVTAGVLAPDDLSVNNRALLAALRRNASACGVHRVVHTADELVVKDGRATGVRAGDTVHRCDVVVLAAGARSARLGGLPDAARPPVVPVKGQVLRLRPRPGGATAALLTHTVRALVHGREVYLVPRTDAELVVGATIEQQGHDRTVTVAGVRRLLQDAQEVLPVLDELALAEAAAGLRPGTPDNGPLVGWSAVGGLFIATGHYRNGILLCGLTGQEVARQVGGSPPGDAWRPFCPRRFDRARGTL